MQNGINEQIQAILRFKQQGMTPQQVMNILMQQNPQIQQNIQTLQNQVCLIKNI